MIELYQSRAGTLALPSPSGKSKLELLVSQKVHRAVGGTLRTVTAGRTRFRMTHKFDGLSEEEAADVISWFEDLPWQVETFTLRKQCPYVDDLVAFNNCRIIGPPTATKHSYNDWELSIVVGYQVLPVNENGDNYPRWFASAGHAPVIRLESEIGGAVTITSPVTESPQETDVNQSLIESPAGVERGWQRGQQYYRLARNFESLVDHELNQLINWFERIDWQGSRFSYRQGTPGAGLGEFTTYEGVRLWGIPQVTKVADNIWDLNAMFEFPVHPNLLNGS